MSYSDTLSMRNLIFVLFTFAFSVSLKAETTNTAYVLPACNDPSVSVACKCKPDPAQNYTSISESTTIEGPCKTAFDAYMKSNSSANDTCTKVANEYNDLAKERTELCKYLPSAGGKCVERLNECKKEDAKVAKEIKAFNKNKKMTKDFKFAHCWAYRQQALYTDKIEDNKEKYEDEAIASEGKVQEATEELLSAKEKREAEKAKVEEELAKAETDLDSLPLTKKSEDLKSNDEIIRSTLDFKRKMDDLQRKLADVEGPEFTLAEQKYNAQIDQLVLSCYTKAYADQNRILSDRNARIEAGVYKMASFGDALKSSKKYQKAKNGKSQSIVDSELSKRISNCRQTREHQTGLRSAKAVYELELNKISNQRVSLARALENEQAAYEQFMKSSKERLAILSQAQVKREMEIRAKIPKLQSKLNDLQNSSMQEEQNAMLKITRLQESQNMALKFKERSESLEAVSEATGSISKEDAREIRKLFEVHDEIDGLTDQIQACCAGADSNTLGRMCSQQKQKKQKSATSR